MAGYVLRAFAWTGSTRLVDRTGIRLLPRSSWPNKRPSPSISVTLCIIFLFVFYEFRVALVHRVMQGNLEKMVKGWNCVSLLLFFISFAFKWCMFVSWKNGEFFLRFQGPKGDIGPSGQVGYAGKIVSSCLLLVLMRGPKHHGGIKRLVFM